MKFLLILLGFTYSKLYAQKNIAYKIDSVQKYAEALPLEKRGISYHILAKTQYRKNDSIGLHFSNLAAQNKSMSDSLSVENNLLIAKTYRRLGNYDSAIHYFQQSIAFPIKAQYIKPIVKAYSNFANLERGNNNFEQAARLFNTADSLSSFINDNNYKASILNGMGNLYLYNNDYKKSLSFYYKSLQLDSVKPQFVSAAYTNMAASFINLQNYDSAIVYTFKAIKLKEKINSISGLAQVYNNLGVCFIEVNNFKEARKYLNLSLEKYENEKSISGKIKVYNNLGNISIKEKNYKQAKEYLLKAQQLNKNYKHNYSAIHTQQYLFKLYKAQKNWEKAFFHQQEYYKLNEIKVNIEKAEALQDQQTKYETNFIKQEKEVAEAQSLLEKEKAKRSKMVSWIALFFTIIVLVLIIIIYTRLKLIKKQKIKLDEAYLKLEESTKNELAISNLKALKSQMNPHFIFNLLNSIQALVVKGDIKSSYIYMEKFAILVRQTLNFSDLDLVDLEDEIELLNIYLELEKLRFSEDFEFQIVDNDIEGIEIPPILIQPFIENALVHGLLHKEGKKTLKIEFQLKDKLICIIEDNGIGREEARALKARQGSKFQSFSTKSIEKRFKILNESYKDKFGFEYKDVYENNILTGTRVNLYIPFKRIF